MKLFKFYTNVESTMQKVITAVLEKVMWIISVKQKKIKCTFIVLISWHSNRGSCMIFWSLKSLTLLNIKSIQLLLNFLSPSLSFQLNVGTLNAFWSAFFTFFTKRFGLTRALNTSSLFWNRKFDRMLRNGIYSCY